VYGGSGLLSTFFDFHFDCWFVRCVGRWVFVIFEREILDAPFCFFCKRICVCEREKRKVRGCATEVRLSNDDKTRHVGQDNGTRQWNNPERRRSVSKSIVRSEWTISDDCQSANCRSSCHSLLRLSSLFALACLAIFFS